jgi:quercetin dioxygenase-like cupin family protein
MDHRGFHVTRTTDLIYILSGRVLLDLDASTVELGTGDAVVLQAANHAWRNPTDERVRFLDVLMSEE